MALFRWDDQESAFVNLRTGATHVPAPPVEELAYDWSDDNLPWAYESAADWEARLPAGVPVVNISTASGDFWTNLNTTQNAQSGRFICRLPEGVFTLNSFRKIGSGTEAYAFGFWFPKLAGFVGAGPDKTIIEMAPDSVSQAQLDVMSGMTQASFDPLNMAMMRIDTQYQSVAAPAYLGGLTVEAAPQNLLMSISADIGNNVYVPQPAPHHGVVFYSDSSRRHPDTVVTHTRFRGAGRAMTSQPPFEMSNFSSQRNHVTFYNSEFDGRLSPRFDSSQPRKCSPIMHNGGVTIVMEDCWMHHSNISRYAANDESVVSGTALTNLYRCVRVKAEQITNNQNRQPSLNSGNSLGGYTNATPFGWESTNAKIEMIDCIVSQDNDQSSNQVPMHLQLTNVGGVARTGGRLVVQGGQYRNTGWTHLDGFVGFRIMTSSAWWTDGFATTLDVKNSQGVALTSYVVTGTWPPTAQTLASAGVTPQTHYLVRSAG